MSTAVKVKDTHQGISKNSTLKNEVTDRHQKIILSSSLTYQMQNISRIEIKR